MSTLVSIRNLHKTYQRGPEKVDVLNGIDLDIEKGDFVALMGPSGSGKTTLLNLIGGLDSPSDGEITIEDERRNISVTFDDQNVPAAARTLLGFLQQRATPRKL